MADAQADRTLDIRELSEPPFDPIMSELAALAPGSQLVLINSFEPTPLYGILEQRGFAYETEQVDSDEWHIRIRQRGDSGNGR